MGNKLTATTSVTVHAPAREVWDALTKPALVKTYLMGADLKTDWKEGSPIRYTGEYNGKPYEEKGVVKKVEPPRLLQTTHFSAMSGKEDDPENYALVTYELEEQDGQTLLTVSQDNIADEKGIEGSKRNWQQVLQGLKHTVEALHAPAPTRS
jgi:uncharacterized protein YndB with AHSA1/START domain